MSTPTQATQEQAVDQLDPNKPQHPGFDVAPPIQDTDQETALRRAREFTRRYPLTMKLLAE